MSGSQSNPWLHRFCLLTAAVTLVLIAIGGLVTSKEAGMAVPDWPNSYGYNMFLFPVSKWAGGILYEHSHRLAATLVGVLVVALTRWLGGPQSRLPLGLIGFAEFLLGVVLLLFAPRWKGAGHFLSGIGGVVLLAALVWVKNQPAARPLPQLGWLAFGAVQLQGLLGGLRVVLLNNQIGIFHATLAQLFFLLLCVICVMTTGWWPKNSKLKTQNSKLKGGVFCVSALILVQLILGATMRHQHAGLAIPDFPLAYGRLWPAMDQHAVAFYNSQRMETTTVNSITGFQIGLQMTHRIMALLILLAVSVSAWMLHRAFGPRSIVARTGLLWLGLVLVQALLGATTIWWNKPADVATAHVVVGAFLLATGGLLCLIASRTPLAARSPIPAGAHGTTRYLDRAPAPLQ